jgi:hypothetical protein
MRLKGMFKKNRSTLITALITGAGLISLASYQRYVGPIDVSASAFFIAAAVILVSSTLYGFFRRKTCGTK